MNSTISAIAAGLAAVAAVGLAAPAAAAPMGDGDAAATISMLEAEGNRVIVNRLSDVPLEQADIVGLNRGAAIRETVRDDFSDRTYQWTVTGHVYYVDVR